mmetsp:Transcript_32939/g.97221  ORF Transcript_32939/g.97221 Transcript_32939/m.97221 type:complete len:81 (-) Transcript_32939:82-324(-)
MRHDGRSTAGDKGQGGVRHEEDGEGRRDEAHDGYLWWAYYFFDDEAKAKAYKRSTTCDGTAEWKKIRRIGFDCANVQLME